jgi:hypothetical protein
MPSTTYNTTSPYYSTPQTSFSLDLWPGIDIPAYDTDQTLVLPGMYTNKPHLLAYDLYGDPRLWWVFSVRNPDIIKDPIYDMVAGIQLQITQKDTLLGLLNVG